MGAPELIVPGTASGTAPVGGSGTLNTIPRWTGASTLGDSGLTDDGTTITAANRALSWTRTSGLVGTFNRQDGNEAILALATSGAVRGYVGASASKAFNVFNAAATSELVTVLNSGNVGIGTASPGYRLDVNVTPGSASGAVLSNGGSGNDIARWTVNTTTGEILFGQARAAAGSYFLTFYTVGAERVRIDSNGNVGVGMTSGFSGKLGVLSANAISTADVTFSYDATGSYRHGFSNVFSSGTAANNTSTWLVWNAAGGQTQVMTANGAGNVGIGTASPISPLHVKGNATNTDGILTLTPNTGGRNHQVQSLQASSLFRIFDQSAGVSRLEIDINGNISATTTGGTFNASTTNAGIKLPATPGNTDPNTLDCYADGGTANSGGVTWTPTLKFGGNTTGITYNTQMGRYTRIGNMVFASCYIRLTSKGTATGAATIDGLPTCVNLAGFYAAGAIGYTAAITSTGTMQINMLANQTQLTIRQVTAAGVNTAVTDTDFANGSEIIVSISYPVT